MYSTNYFKAADDEEVLSFMQAHPFVTICGINDKGQPAASHIPVQIENREGRLFLLGHVMRKQDHTLAFSANPDVLVIFSGPHAYISASWYADQKMASTWNYQVVHASGKLKFLDDEALRALLTKLTGHFEGRPDSPALVHHMSEEYIATNIKAIIAFEVEVTELQHSFKMSQNRTEKDYDNIIVKLSHADAESKLVAEIMSARKEKVFNIDNPIS